MKIAVVHNQMLTAKEAGVVFVTGAASGYALAGASTVLMLPGTKGQPGEALRDLGQNDPPAFEMQRLPRISWTVGSFKPSWSGPFRMMVVRHLRAGRFDVVVVRDLKLSDLLVRTGLNSKIVYEMHNLFSIGQDGLGDTDLFPAKKLKMHQARVETEKRILSKVDGVIALTAGLVPIIESDFNLTGRVVAGGSALVPLAAPTKKAKHPTDIAYIGSLDPHKGVGTLVRTLPSLPEAVRLLLFGHGRHGEPLMMLAKDLGVSHRLVFPGWFSPADLPGQLVTCFAAAVPLEDCFYNRYVTSPMKLFDYARAAVVPVVPGLPVFTELFPDNDGAVIVEDSRPELWSRAFAELYENRDFRAQKEAELARFAVDHTWRKRAEALLPFFNGLRKR